MKRIIFLYFILISLPAMAQDATILDRLQAIANGGVVFYNVDGVTVTSEVVKAPFSKSAIRTNFGEFVPSDSLLNNSDKTLPYPNYTFVRTDSLPGLMLNTSYYFIEYPKGSMTFISYGAYGKSSTELEHTLNPLILNKQIPPTCFNKMLFNSINFAGRKIELGTYAAKWQRVNCVQWAYNGEMNWSVHRDSTDAALAVETQRIMSVDHIGKEMESKVLSDEYVNVIFEGAPVIARKVTISPSDEIAGMLDDIGDVKTNALIIYYVVAPVRGLWVSCVLSHWNNDIVGEDGLPALLGKVMSLSN